MKINTKRKYVGKIYIIDMDPFIIRQPKYPPEVVSCDLELVSILFHTKENFKNFRSLLICVHGVGVYYAFLGQIIRDKYVVLARVRHSQRVNDPRVQSNRCALI